MIRPSAAIKPEVTVQAWSTLSRGATTTTSLMESFEVGVSTWASSNLGEETWETSSSLTFLVVMSLLCWDSLLRFLNDLRLEEALTSNLKP